MLFATENTLTEKAGVCFLLLFIVAGIYFNAFSFGFVNYDDHVYITYLENLFSDGVTIDDFGMILSDNVNANYHPVTVLSLAFDYLVSGNSEAFYHGVNVFIHFFNVCLVYFLILLLSDNKKIALITAILFAIHPLNVESVAWISERKGVLSVFFALLSINFYLVFCKTDISRYKYLSVLSFFLSLLSKPTTAMLPIILVLIDIVLLDKNNPINSKLFFRRVVNKTPYFIVVGIVITMSFFAQIEGEGLKDFATVSFQSRIENTISNIFQYVYKILFPFNLSSFYPMVKVPYYLLAIYCLIFVSILIILLKKGPRQWQVFFGLLFFILMIFPMLGLFQTGMHVIAERYTYLPAIGIFFIIAFLLNMLKNRVFIPVLGVLIFGYGALTFNQVEKWKSSFSLWENNVLNTAPNYVSGYYYSKSLLDLNRVDEAVWYFNKIIGIENKFYGRQAVNYFSDELIKNKKYDEARFIIQRGLEAGVADRNLYRQLAVLDYFVFGNKQGSQLYIESELRNNPKDYKLYRILARMLMEQNKVTEALEVLDKASLISDDIEVLNMITQDRELVNKKNLQVIIY